MLADEFSQVFRAEHRQVRDTLLGLVQAFGSRDLPRARSELGRAAALTGPHFRYEEESLYPALVEFYGQGYVRKLLADHDKAIGSAKRLVEMAEADSLSDEDAEKAVRFVRGMLPHVSDCDGLSIMVECLSEEQVQAILDSRSRSLDAGLNLLEWAETLRTRRVIVPK